MKDVRLICKYKYNGKEYGLTGNYSEYLDADYTVNDDVINLTLKPKAKVELTTAYFEFDHDFKDDDKFFANGYQSWTTSKEYKKNDVQLGINKLAKMYPFIKLSGISPTI